MNTATLVEETLRGLPDKITVYMPWDDELDEAGLWDEPGTDISPYQFPCMFVSREKCEKEIASFAIGTLEAVIRGDMSLPTNLDYPREFTLSRNGDLSPNPYPGFSGANTTLFDLIHRQHPRPLDEQTFNREFAHYYAGLVAQQRNKN